MGEQFSGDDLNCRCFDSGLPPAWASVSHGIYISIGAAGVHRSLDVRVSRVQSLEMDAWKPLHVRMMQLGGNRRFSEFLLEHGVKEDMPIRAKYFTRAADWYRKNLLAEAEGSEPPAPLPAGTGALPMEGVQPEAAVLDKVFADLPPCRLQGGASSSQCEKKGSDASGMVCRLMLEGFKVVLGSAKSPRDRGNCSEQSKHAGVVCITGGSLPVPVSSL